MDTNKGPAQPDEQHEPTPARSARRRYETPRLVEYGSVGKLTLTGGITTKDLGNIRQMCL
jgi:hypothetical protein